MVWQAKKMDFQPISSNRNSTPQQTTIATAPSMHQHAIKQEIREQQPQQDGYHHIMWATTSSSSSSSHHFGHHAPEYATLSPSTIVSPPQQHISVIGPAYTLHRNRSLMPGPPSPPIHPSWSSSYTNNSNSFATTWIGPSPSPLDAWKSSGSNIPVFYQVPPPSTEIGGSSKELQNTTRSSPHDSEERHGNCISPTSPSPSPSTLSSTTSIQQRRPSSSRKQKQPWNRTEEEEESKRQLYLVKNRQAASKCRQRKKEWIAHMQETMASYTAENDGLQQQVIMLREEVLHLKTMLLMYKDCPQAQANGVYGLDSIPASSSSHW